MIDFRHQTFLKLCQIKNYTKTAKKLHITQPTVSQHIKHLEEYYQVKLFNYSGKKLKITEAGKKLYQYTERMIADSREIKNILQQKNEFQNIKLLQFFQNINLHRYLGYLFHPIAFSCYVLR